MRLSAEQGRLLKITNLGMSYLIGQEVAQDYKEAFKWLRLAAKQGEEQAQFNLAQMYYLGQGVPKDIKEAIKLWRLSAEQGYALAMINLGTMYYDGDGVPQDYVLAHMWYNLAGSARSKNAVERRKIVEEQMTPQQIEKAQEMARNRKTIINVNIHSPF